MNNAKSNYPYIGVSIKSYRGWDSAYPVTNEENVAMAVAVGAKMIRFDVNWQDCETSLGVYNFTAVKALVDKAFVNGIHCLIILAGGHTLYTGAWDAPAITPTARVGFKNFAVALAAYLGTGHYEIMNEPNNSDMFGGPINPEMYGRLANEVILGFQAAGITRPLYTAGMAVGGPPAGGFMDSKDFMTAMLPFITTTAAPFKAFGMHPYTGADQYISTDPMMRPESMLARMKAMLPANQQNRPTVNTEQGFSVPHCLGSTHAIRKIRQGVFAQKFVLSALMGYNACIWYDLVDDGLDENNPEHNYGLFDHSMTIKPSGIEFAKITSLMAWSTSMLAQKDGDMFRTQFITPAKTITVGWSAYGTVNFPISESDMPFVINI